MRLLCRSHLRPDYDTIPYDLGIVSSTTANSYCQEATLEIINNVRATIEPILEPCNLCPGVQAPRQAPALGGGGDLALLPPGQQQPRHRGPGPGGRRLPGQGELPLVTWPLTLASHWCGVTAPLSPPRHDVVRLLSTCSRFFTRSKRRDCVLDLALTML